MNTEEQSRQLMTQKRQDHEHLQDNLVERAAQDIAEYPISDTEERSRELLAQERQHQEHLQENLLTRATEEIK